MSKKLSLKQRALYYKVIEHFILEGHVDLNELIYYKTSIHLQDGSSYPIHRFFPSNLRTNDASSPSKAMSTTPLILTISNPLSVLTDRDLQANIELFFTDSYYNSLTQEHIIPQEANIMTA